MRSLAVAIVVLHALVLIGHDVAHRSLGVGLNAWQLAFAYSVIVAVPLVAALALYTQRARLAFTLLSASMFGALVFSVYHHYVLISPDHVFHLPEGRHQGLFEVTAAAMAVLELAGVVVGLVGRRRLAR